MTRKNEVKTVELPKIARRAIALVNAELQKTIGEAADLVGVDPNDGWQLSADLSCFRRKASEKEG